MVMRALRIVSEGVCLRELVREGFSEEEALQPKPESRKGGSHLDFWMGVAALFLLDP